MVGGTFQFAGMPKLHCGVGVFGRLAVSLPAQTRRVLAVTGSFPRTNAEAWARMTGALDAAGITLEAAHIHHEPDVGWIDRVVEQYRGTGVDAVVAIGGGSALDAGKAVAAMLTTEPGDPVLNYLENEPHYRPHSGRRLFVAAVPTTSGTGSEATKNAVIAVPGGFKRSIRHERFIPDVALVDGSLTLSCPPAVKAASGLDALTQLIESYVSVNASPLTDALALSGLEAAAEALVPICTRADADADLHGRMAYAATLSGVTLAHAGLGVVHGVAGPAGGSFSVPHGVVCGTLLAEATRRNIARLREERAHSPQAALALRKYARVGAVLTGHDARDGDGCLERLTAALDEWTALLHVPRLGQYGMSADAIDAVVDAADNKQSPVRLDKAEIRAMLEARL